MIVLMALHSRIRQRFTHCLVCQLVASYICQSIKSPLSLLLVLSMMWEVYTVLLLCYLTLTSFPGHVEGLEMRLFWPKLYASEE